MTARLERWREEMGRLGRAGAVGIALLLAGAVVELAAVAPLEAERRALAAEARAFAADEDLKAGRASRVIAAEQLAAFYASFPPAHTSPEWLGKMHAAARAKHLALRTGEYKLERRPDEKLVRYGIILPVTGRYREIREFVAELLVAVPAAALEEIALKRDSVDTPKVEARIRLTLYLAGP
jgi:hypothetical protein